MKTLKILWYETDRRFKPGTVADIGRSIRLTLVEHKGIEYRLYLETRTAQRHGAGDNLKGRIIVAKFKKCESLEDAQRRASEWFTEWLFSMVNDTNFLEVLYQ